MILQIDFPIGTMSSVEFSPLFSIGLFLESSSQESHQVYHFLNVTVLLCVSEPKAKESFAELCILFQFLFCLRLLPIRKPLLAQKVAFLCCCTLLLKVANTDFRPLLIWNNFFVKLLILKLFNLNRSTFFLHRQVCR